MNLCDIPVGHWASITHVDGDGGLRQHFLDMGLIPGIDVHVEKLAPMGDPMEIQVHGYELTLRLSEAEKIKVKPLEKQQHEIETSHKIRKKIHHPGLGEGGKFHLKGDGDPLPEGTLLSFALVGNQNCGKTTLFNQLTGSNQHVGNFPGVTVDRKDGPIRGERDTLVTDLPGIYSMSPYTSEEIVSRNFVLNDRPKAIINILDATNIERNLYLTMQLLDMQMPMVVALNMMDELTGNGGTVDINGIEEMLGVPVVPISAAKNSGVHELIEHAMHIARYQEKPIEIDFCSANDHGGAIHRCLHGVRLLISDHAERAGIPVAFAAAKLVEGDPLILEQLALDDNEKDMLEHIICQMETECGMDRSAAIADMRFDYIRKVCEETVIKPRESKEHIRSRKIDIILTGKYTAIPVFVLIMISVFLLTFNVIGPLFQGLIESGVHSLRFLTDDLLTRMAVNPVIRNLIIEGIFTGVGSVISFLPVIVILFFFLSILEDSGYVARVAFFMDKLLRKIGLSGRSIVPMLIGFGCTVPAVMATRTLPSERDRRLTILLTPFMSCSAKMPIYAFISAMFFPQSAGLVMAGLYLIGILMGILCAFVYKGTVFKGEAVPFVMELPNYRLPSLKNVGQLLWEKAKDFLQRAFGVIMIASIVIWFLQNFDLHLNLIMDSSKDQSILALLAGLITPLFAPLGLNDWRICTALISGFMAKESIVSTMGVLFGGTITSILSAKDAAAMLVFSLLYTPCIAAIAAIKRELGGKWAIGVVLWQCAIAWICAFLIRIAWGIFVI